MCPDRVKSLMTQTLSTGSKSLMSWRPESLTNCRTEEEENKISGMQWHKEYLSSVNFPSRQERHVEGAHEGNDAREASHGWTTILGELTAVGLAGKRWAGGCQHGVPQEGYDAVKMQTGQWGNYSVRETLQLRSATPPQWCSWNGGLKWSRPLPACIIVYSGYVSWLYSHSP